MRSLGMTCSRRARQSCWRSRSSVAPRFSTGSLTASAPASSQSAGRSASSATAPPFSAFCAAARASAAEPTSTVSTASEAPADSSSSRASFSATCTPSEAGPVGWPK